MMYRESSPPMVQIVVSDISEPSKPIAFLHAALLSPHKAVAYLKFGRNCQQYKISALAETGLLAGRPAIQFRVDYARTPSSVKKIAHLISSIIDEMACKFGLSQKKQRTARNVFKVTAAEVSPGLYSALVSTHCKVTTVSEISVPLSLRNGRLDQDKQQQIYPLSTFLDVRSLLLKNQTGVCSVYHENLTTFSGAEIETILVPNCPLILVEEKWKMFSIMMMQVSRNDFRKILLIRTKVDIEVSRPNGEFEVKLNNVLVDMNTLSGRLAGDNSISITRKGDKLVIELDDHIKCYYDGDNITLEANPATMPGRLRGLCGQFDGEPARELQTPGGYKAKNALSFVQSWVHTEGPCEGACKLQHSFKKLEDSIEHLGEQSDCYTTEQVLQCRKDCSATSAVSIPVALHCLPAGSTMNLIDTQTRLDQKSDDMVYLVEAHTSCSCENQLCAA